MGGIDEWRLINQFKEGLEHGLSQEHPLQSWWEYGIEHTTYREGLYPQTSPPVSFPFREAQPAQPFEHLGYRTDYSGAVPVQPVPAGAPREATVLPEVAPTPTPSSDRVRRFPPGIGAPSAEPQREPARKAKSKEPSTSGGSGYFAVFHQGRKISWP